MNTAVINVKVDPKLKKQAQAVAGDLGFTLSSLINAYLRQVVRDREVGFSDVRLELTPYAKKMLKQAEKDVKAGRVLSFTPQKALDHLDTMIRDDENSQG